ncbi:hypothetical protein Tco_0451056 [Tanacetum coccineum]
MGKSESVFQLTTNEIYRHPSEPSRQEEFVHIVMNFIFDQEERIRQLEDYMQVIVEEFMEFSSEVARRLKERIKENENKPRKIKKITRYPDTKVLENSAKHNFLENLEKKTFPTPANLLYEMSKRTTSTKGKASSSREETMEEKVRRYEPLYKGVTFRLGGVEREISLLELGWRVSLYSKRKSRDVATLSGLRRAEMVNSTHPPPHDYRKKSLVKMGVIIELHEGECCWPVTRGVIEEDEGDDEEGDGERGNEGSGGSADIYQNMSTGDWQVRQARWMDQQDGQWGRSNTWMEQQDQMAYWMYNHTVHQFQHMSTRDNLKPHLQIDPFPGFEADYPPYGYHRHMPPGYAYRPDPSHDGSF